MNPRRVLFAIRDPAATRQPGLAKAIQVAGALGASLELFHAITDPVFIEFASVGDRSIEAVRERVENEARIPLARLCEKARKHGVEAGYSVAWDYPPHEAVVRRATTLGAELIIAECHKGARTRAWLIHLTDWELLRTSPVPVLLIKNARPYHRPLVLAAVDPTHAHAKPAELDERIVASASELSKTLRGNLHIMHASYPSIVGGDVTASTKHAASSWTTFTFGELAEHDRAAFEEFRSVHRIPRTRAHLVEGNPSAQIPRLARKLGAGIVVMGALSRSGLQRIFIGNTAERILGTLECDVLAIKPETFATRIAREERGIRLLAPTTSLVS